MRIGLHVGDVGLGSITEDAVRKGVIGLREMDAFETARDFGMRQRALRENIDKACEVVASVARGGLTQ